MLHQLRGDSSAEISCSLHYCLCQGRGTARAVALADDCSVLVTSVECRTHNVVVLVWQYQLQQLLSSAVL